MSKTDEFTAIPARVANGAAWLDTERPGWERQIDLGTLNIAEKCACVCGQTGGFETALASLTGRTCWSQTAVDHGFAMDGIILYDDADVAGYWQCLTEAWVGLIKMRFDAGALSDG